MIREHAWNISKTKKSYEDVVHECKNLISYTAVNTEPVFLPQTNVMFRK